MNLNQVTFPVKNMQATTDFYRQMGFLQIVDTPHYARFECPQGGSSFSLSLKPTATEYSGEGYKNQPEGKQNYVVVYFEHQDLDEWCSQLIAKGFKFTQLPTEQTYLWREAILYDPSGNKIILYWAGKNRLNPPWRVKN